MYKWLPLNATAELSRLTALLAPEYDPANVAKKLQAGISNAVKAVLIETPYIDKDYRSTYYNFYAKKGLRYSADCVRLHFFAASVDFNETTLQIKCPEGSGKLSEYYFGYTVLRPTTIATIGRTVLSPEIRKGATGQTILAKHKVHLLGYKLNVEGFPSMNQHLDISVCAHAACWSILRHYSERYHIYREFLTHDITTMAHEFNPGGLVPSKGLEVWHAERVFQEAGTFPIHVTRERPKLNDTSKNRKGRRAKKVLDGDLSFYRQLLAYVDSAFPLFAAMHEQQHAVAVIGYSWKNATGTAAAPRHMGHAWDKIESLRVVDDHYLPYARVPVEPSQRPSSELEHGGEPSYSAQDIDSFIVALPEKIYYSAGAVDTMASVLFKPQLSRQIGLPPKEDTIVRYFITTGSALRHFVREHESEFDPCIVEKIMMMPFAQFVWVVEFATEEQWDRGRITARAIIDATASHLEPAPFWLIHGPTKALFFDRETLGIPITNRAEFREIKFSPATGYSRMEQNLRPITSKA